MKRNKRKNFSKKRRKRDLKNVERQVIGKVLHERMPVPPNKVHKDKKKYDQNHRQKIKEELKKWY